MAAAHALNGPATESAKTIARALNGKPIGDGKFLASCPAHDDKTPSLSIADDRGKALFYCHAGCTQTEVLDALRGRGLWPSNVACKRDAISQTDAHVYKDETGAPLYRVIRRPGKQFFQERYDNGQ